MKTDRKFFIFYCDDYEQIIDFDIDVTVEEVENAFRNYCRAFDETDNAYYHETI